MENKKPLIIILCSILLIIIFFITWAASRSQPFIYTIRNFVVIMILLGAIGGIIWMLIWLFRAKNVDMVQMMKTRILEACELGQFPAPKQMIMVGYTKEQGAKMALQMMHNKGLIKIENKELLNELILPIEEKFVGYVTGMCKMQTEPLYRNTFDEAGNIVAREMVRKPQKITLFAFQRSLSAASKLMSDPQIFAGFDDEGDFSDLNGDVIKLYDMAFSPSLYKILFLAKYYRDTNRIDEVAKELIFRYQTQENLKKVGEMFDASYAIAEKYRKEHLESIASQAKAQMQQAKK